MDIKHLSEELAVSDQLQLVDIQALADQGFRSVICNRPDGEGEGKDQPAMEAIKSKAEELGLHVRYIPVVPGNISDDDVLTFSQTMHEIPKPALAYCRTGTRSATLWALSQANKQSIPDILSSAKATGYDLSDQSLRLANGGKLAKHKDISETSYDVVIVGAGAAGISVASSLISRRLGLNILIIDPKDIHYYQPGWTMVGAGVFAPEDTVKTMGSLIPKGVSWLKATVVAFEPKKDIIILENGQVVKYSRLIVCPGLKLDWKKVEGLTESLGRYGVTSNYRYDLAVYTWSLVQSLKSGRAIFTQSPMPIKCAGAPQKALYLSADYWNRHARIKDIEIDFNNAGGVLFGVKEYVPVLESYIERYQASVNYFHNLVAVDGPAGKAWFDVSEPGQPIRRVKTEFDMMHVCPPQCAPDFISASPLIDAAGWIAVEQTTMRHKTFDNIWALGDVTNAPNAKTAAAARKQAPVVAANIDADIAGKPPVASYDGYGSCPLTVEKGKIVLAEFGYEGKLLPSFPKWLIDGSKPSKMAWLLKSKVLPPIYWKAMLRGHEWMAEPNQIESAKKD